jgi:membrane protease YdiL (CAAX protease family)
MSADEAGIIGGAAGGVPAAPPPRAAAWGPALEEGAWLLLAVAATWFIGAGLQALGGRAAAAAPGATLFALHGLVGLHVLRTERAKLSGWFDFDRRGAILGVAGGGALLAFNAGYGLVLELAKITPPDTVAQLRGFLPGPLLVAWAGVLAPAVEEMYFRGRLLDALDVRVGRGWSAAITSTLFAAAHGVTELVPAYVGLALALLWLRRRSGGLVAPILAHMINNAVALM